MHLRPRIAFVAAMIAMLGAAQPAWPQAAPAQAPLPVPAPALPPAQEDSPGLVGEIGKLLRNPSSILPNFNTPRESADEPKPQPSPPDPQPADIKPPEAPALPTIPSMVTGRAVCPASATGGPDCKAGADALCKSKGFAEGKSLTSDAVEKCSARLLIPGRQRQPGDCRTESFVTRAWCR
jgi:hypothetical protein